MRDFHHYALGQENPMLSAHADYEALNTTALERKSACRELSTCASSADETRVQEIRAMTNMGRPYGSERFEDETEAALKRAARPPQRARPPNSARPEADPTET
jgi:hypothetical protein